MVRAFPAVSYHERVCVMGEVGESYSSAIRYIADSLVQ